MHDATLIQRTAQTYLSGSTAGHPSSQTDIDVEWTGKDWDGEERSADDPCS